jgi:hypothetical protein
LDTVADTAERELTRMVERRAREYEQAAQSFRRILFGEDLDPATTAAATEAGRVPPADAGARGMEPVEHKSAGQLMLEALADSGAIRDRNSVRFF